MTTWGKNPFVLGAWASATPGKADLRKNIKTSVADKLFLQEKLQQKIMELSTELIEVEQG